ncbi:MAG: DUF6152 family protein [Gammaproteobacteria bacterium]
MKRPATIGVSIALLLALTYPSFAHHSFAAEFDAKKPMKVTGAVTKLEWQNPHTWFYVDVKDDKGELTNWGFELASPNLLLRNGWTKSTLKVGDVVTVDAFQAKNGTRNANARAVTLNATGKSLLAGSSGASSNAP